MQLKKILNSFLLFFLLISMSGCSFSGKDEELSVICDALNENTKKYEEALYAPIATPFESMKAYKSYISFASKVLNKLETSDERIKVGLSLLTLESYLSEYLLYEEFYKELTKATFGKEPSQGWTPLSANRSYSEKIYDQKFKIRVASALARVSCSDATSTPVSIEDLELIGN
jgi:hypothetical protein